MRSTDITIKILKWFLLCTFRENCLSDIAVAGSALPALVPPDFIVPSSESQSRNPNVLPCSFRLLGAPDLEIP